MTILVYGASDDLIEIEGDITAEFNVYEEKNYVVFSNGTVLKVTYDGDWNIKWVYGGDSNVEIQVVNDSRIPWTAQAPEYSDIARIGGKVEWVCTTTEMVSK